MALYTFTQTATNKTVFLSYPGKIATIGGTPSATPISLGLGGTGTYFIFEIDPTEIDISGDLPILYWTINFNLANVVLGGGSGPTGSMQCYWSLEEFIGGGATTLVFGEATSSWPTSSSVTYVVETGDDPGTLTFQLTTPAYVGVTDKITIHLHCTDMTFDVTPNLTITATDVPPIDIYTEVGSGGAVGGGTSTPRRVLTSTGSGGALGGGTAAVSKAISLRGSGGAVAGGAAIKTTPVLHYPNSLPWANSITLGSDTSVIVRRTFASKGGVTVGGTAAVKASYRYVATGKSADASPDFAGISIGYQNNLNPTVVSNTINIDYRLRWRQDAYVIVDTDFVWNTGKLRQYWYRIIGKGRNNVCPPIEGEECCMKMILNIHASTINDLCQKLKDREWKWPIELVQRFSKPAENAAVAEDREAGIDFECNRLEDVEVCTNLLCAEFCIDHDIVDYWGGYSNGSVTKAMNVTSTSGVFIGGAATYSYVQNKFSASYVANGGITVGGTAEAISSGYSYTSTGGLVMGGSAKQVSSAWHFTGGVYPYDTLAKSARTASEIIESGTDQIWNLTNRVFTSNNLHTICDVSYLNTSRFLVVDNFGFNVPAGMEIIGIEATIERQASSTVRDLEVYLVVNDEIVSDNLAYTSTNWPISVDSTVTYGGNSNIWRDPNDEDYLGPWDINDINDSSFGLAVRVKGFTNSPGVLALIDHIQLRIYYADAQHQTLRLSGAARVRSSTYAYTATGGLTTGGTSPLKHGRKYISNGRGAIGPLFSALTLGGQYGLNLHTEATGGVEVGGSARVRSTHWSYEATGGVDTGGTARLRSTAWSTEGSGGITLASANRMRTAFRYNTSGGVTLDSETLQQKRFSYNASGGLSLDGRSNVKSSAFTWISDGNVVFVGGSADVRFADQEGLVEYIGIFAEVEDLLILYGTDETETVGVIDTPDSSVNKCGCEGLPLAIPYAHNMFGKNKLEQFLKRNNLTLPTSSNLLYNRVNDSWQANIHLDGYSPNAAPNSLARENWNIIFDLQCTNTIGGQTLGQSVWKLSAQIVQKNFITLQDFDTRLVIGFLPEGLCDDAGDFKIVLTYNTVTGAATADKNVTIYQSILYDNLGLFKNAYWLDNPNLVFSISQSGIAANSPRYPLNI